MMAEISKKYHISDLDREISIEITKIRKNDHLHFVFVQREIDCRCVFAVKC